MWRVARTLIDADTTDIQREFKCERCGNVVKLKTRVVETVVA